MTENEANVEETIMLTRRERRRGAARPDAGPGPHGVPHADADAAEALAVPADDETDELDESTVIVDRSARAVAPEERPAEADFPEADEVDESTVIVDRSARTAVPEQPPLEAKSLDEANEPDAPDEPDELDESTVIVDRSAPAVPSDVASGAPDAPQDAAVPEAADSNEATVVVSRGPRRPWGRRKPADEERPAEDVVPTVESFERPTDAPTPAIYKPRPAPAGPQAPPVISGAPAPTRVDDPERPSVAKQARRWSLYTMVAFVTACVVSVAGLIGVGFLVLG